MCDALAQRVRQLLRRQIVTFERDPVGEPLIHGDRLAERHPNNEYHFTNIGLAIFARSGARRNVTDIQDNRRVDLNIIG